MNKIIKNPFEKKHKGTVFALCIVYILLAGSFLSCSKKECPKEPVCNVNNPLTDLSWLKERVNSYRKGGDNPHARIYQCTYKDGIGFLVDDCVDCIDHAFTLYNCEGITLCTIGGAAGSVCAEYNLDIKNKKLIWEINR